jgi:hypothetical protein
MTRSAFLAGSVAKNILATISCAADYVTASISYVIRNFLQHYRCESIIQLADHSTRRRTLELTGHEHTAFNIIGEDDDERNSIERSG